MSSFRETSPLLFLTRPSELKDYFEKGKKTLSSLRVGLEHEKFVFEANSLQRVPYGTENGLSALFKDFLTVGWEGIYENTALIGLKKEGVLLTLEPGGQLEFSSSPHSNVFALKEEHQRYLLTVLPLASQKNLLLLGLGFDPLSNFEDIPWMPKERYLLMRDYMPQKGSLGLDMMTRTASFQVSLDYTSEQDMCEKFRIGLALQPLISTFFASSVLRERQILPFQSYRSYVWQHTDDARTGGLEFVFDDRMGFERYIEYLLDIPLYFIYRNGKYIPAAPQTFRDFMRGNLKSLPGKFPTITDWELHISTVFPDVRLKTYLEMRGADSGPLEFGYALAALWAGLFYDPQSLTQIKDIVGALSQEERSFLRKETPKTGIHTQFRGKPLKYLLATCLEISQEGLKRRNICISNGKDESCFLEPLFQVLDRNESLSDSISKKWKTFSSQEKKNNYIRSLKYSTKI
ncbi:MAG: glutamate--cysteine ligase [Alphaproteobacteria bacterium 16-39-46]|nr:MAG: glutamate--cysteine ligase [Alphaproteobacteria bacterium 16-39-46]OZA44072.1 MAG: glutamate--cysteine ligase [Alphaproteobacteria bacterium 17-39-52]HQS83588.1 glutamate--cysteine ligase [Alphaproteobacteria bacterium]HQS93377.1 glutamate--cysteine ligase [Alphaproteobacteria bacterium]